MTRGGALLVALVIGATGCQVNAAFHCERDEQCRRGSEIGICEPNGYCSFSDGVCPMGSRYDDLAGDDEDIDTGEDEEPSPDDEVDLGGDDDLGMEAPTEDDEH